MNPLIRLLRRVVWQRMADGVPLTDEEITALARKLLPIVQQHRRREYATALKYIRTTVPTVKPAALRPYKVDAIEKVIEEATTPQVEVSAPRVTLDDQSRKQSRAWVTVDETNRTDPAVSRVVADRMGATLARHARQAGREAITDTADSAGDRIGWARVLTGEENCGFCAMLASRGPVYTSEKAARFRGGQRADAFHDHCDCGVVLVRKGREWAGSDEYDRLEQLWIDSTAGLGGKDALKAFTRAYKGEEPAPATGESRPSKTKTRTPAVKPAESKRDQALRHLPTLRATLSRLLAEGRSEDSEPVKYTRKQIAKFESYL